MRYRLLLMPQHRWQPAQTDTGVHALCAWWGFSAGSHPAPLPGAFLAPSVAASRLHVQHAHALASWRKMCCTCTEAQQPRANTPQHTHVVSRALVATNVSINHAQRICPYGNLHGSLQFAGLCYRPMCIIAVTQTCQPALQALVIILLCVVFATTGCLH